MSKTLDTTALAQRVYACGTRAARKSLGQEPGFDKTWGCLTIHQQRGFIACVKLLQRYFRRQKS